MRYKRQCAAELGSDMFRQIMARKNKGWKIIQDENGKFIQVKPNYGI